VGEDGHTGNTNPGVIPIVTQERTALNLQLVIMLCAAVLMGAVQWFGMQAKITDVDNKQTAALIALTVKVDSNETAKVSDHRLLCLIAKKLNIDTTECLP
jgi:hypothetical protein